MTLLSTIFPDRVLLRRVPYGWQAGNYALAAPPLTAFMRCSMVGGGSNKGGAAFARVKAVAAPGEAFTLAVGRGSQTKTGTGANTVLTRNTGSVIICRAQGGQGEGLPGLVAGSIGDTKRAGSAGVDFSAVGDGLYTGDVNGGTSGSDEGDTHALGIGGPGAFMRRTGGSTDGNFYRAALYGGGGLFDQRVSLVDVSGPDFTVWTIPCGDGRALVEWFASDPGY